MRTLIKAGVHYDLYVSSEPVYSELKDHHNVFQIVNREYDVLVAEGVHEVQAHQVLMAQDEAKVEFLTGRGSIGSLMGQITGDPDDLH